MLVFLCYLLLLAVAMKFKFAKNLVESVLVTTLLFSAFLVATTEILSLFNALKLTYVAICWTVALITLSGLLLVERKQTFSMFKTWTSSFVSHYRSLILYEKILAFIVVIGLLSLLFQGLVYPPNNWDTLTYHMPRIMYWLGNGSVSHFPTHILRNLYQPPFAEYFIMHVNLLNGNDYFSNSISWLFLVFSLFAVLALLDYLKVSRFHKLLALLLVIAIPSVEMQASTAKNDIVCGFFMLAAIYFCVKTYVESNNKNFALLGLSVGLCMMTKGTAYVFLAPVLLLFGVSFIAKIVKAKNIRLLFPATVALLIIVALNIGHFTRNYAINGDILNVDDVEKKAYSNEHMDGKLLLSSLVKNASLHLGYPIKESSDTLVLQIHRKLGVPVNGDNNYLGMAFETSKQVMTHEDYVSNTTHFFLMFFAFLVVVFHGFKNFGENRESVFVALVVLLQILLFCGFLKWQPWHTRLHIPIFLFAVVLIIAAAHLSKWFNYLLWAAIPVLLFSFYFFLVYNNLRPIIQDRKYTRNIHISDDRFKKYFPNQPQLYPEYSEILDSLYAMPECHKIGILMGGWEYPLLSAYYYDPIKLVALSVSNISAGIPQDTENMDVVISSYNTDSYIFNGRKYINQTPKHTYIWIYK